VGGKQEANQCFFRTKEEGRSFFLRGWWPSGEDLGKWTTNCTQDKRKLLSLAFEFAVKGSLLSWGGGGPAVNRLVRPKLYARKGETLQRRRQGVGRGNLQSSPDPSGVSVKRRRDKPRLPTTYHNVRKEGMRTGNLSIEVGKSLISKIYGGKSHRGQGAHRKRGESQGGSGGGTQTIWQKDSSTYRGVYNETR